MKEHVSEPQEERKNERDLSQGFLGVREVAFYLGVRPSTIYAMVEKRGIPHYRLGRQVRFKRSEIDQWMDSNKKSPVDVNGEARKVFRSIEKKPSMEIDRIVNKVIDGATRKGYTSCNGKPDRIKGLGREVEHGTL